MPGDPWKGALRGLPQFLAWVTWRRVAFSGVEIPRRGFAGYHEFIPGHAGGGTANGKGPSAAVYWNLDFRNNS